MNCPRCNGYLCWGSDFSFEDYGYDSNGIVSNYTCLDCGVEVEVRYPEEE